MTQTMSLHPGSAMVGVSRARRWATATAPTWPTACSFTVRTLADIEHGVRKASPGTYAMLENKLAWAPGSIDTILAGGVPKETVVELRRATHNPLAHTATEAPSRASTEGLLLELRRRIIASRDTRRETWDDWDGLDPHGDWPEQG